MTKKVVREDRMINVQRLRNYCIANDYYDAGTNEEYDNLFKYCRAHEYLSGQNIYEIAKDICIHSSKLDENDEDDEEVITNIMYDLVSKSIIYSVFYIHDIVVDED